MTNATNPIENIDKHKRLLMQRHKRWHRLRSPPRRSGRRLGPAAGGAGALRHAAVVGASIVVAIAVWWVVARLEIWRPLFVPSPESVWDQLVRTESTTDGRRGYSGHYLHEHLWASLRRILQGIGVAILLGRPARPADRRRAARRHRADAGDRLRAQPAAARVLQPARDLVRDRGAPEGGAALPRRAAADRHRDRGRRAQRPGRPRARRPLARRGPAPGRARTSSCRRSCPS